jgi:hypothetical protein
VNSPPTANFISRKDKSRIFLGVVLLAKQVPLQSWVLCFSTPSMDTPISVTCKSWRASYPFTCDFRKNLIWRVPRHLPVAFHRKRWFYVAFLLGYVRICHRNMTKRKSGGEVGTQEFRRRRWPKSRIFVVWVKNFPKGCIFMFDEQMAVVSCRADGDNDFYPVVEYLVWNQRRRVILCDITFIYMPMTNALSSIIFCLLHSILWYVHHAKKCFRSVNKMHAYGRGYVVVNLAMCACIA